MITTARVERDEPMRNKLFCGGSQFRVHGGLHYAAVAEEADKIAGESCRIARGRRSIGFASEAGSVLRGGTDVIRIAPPPCASRISEVSLRASGSGKLSATKTSLPRVVITTGPSSVE